MSWLTTKPNKRVKNRIAIAFGLMFLADSIVRRGAYPDHQTNMYPRTLPYLVQYGMGNTLAGKDAPNFAQRRFLVVEQNGQLVIFDPPDQEYRDLEGTPEAVLLLYVSGTYTTGLFAPTRLVKGQLLIDRDQLWGRNTIRTMAPATPRVLKAQAALVASKRLDARLATIQVIDDERVIVYGYIVNTLYMLFVIAMAWVFLWWSTKFPQRLIQNKRRARMHAGLCPMCAYDLAGTPRACPECGWALDKDRAD